MNAEFQRIARRDKKAFLSYQCKEIEENNRMGKIEIASRKLEISKEYFMIPHSIYKNTKSPCYPPETIMIL